MTALAFLPASAQGQLRTAPHKGSVAKADAYYIEMVPVGDELRFYVLDSMGTTIPTEGITGTALVKFDDGTSSDQALDATTDGYFRTVLMNPASFMVMTSFKVKGASVSAPFHSGARSKVPAARPHSTNDGHQH